MKRKSPKTPTTMEEALLMIKELRKGKNGWRTLCCDYANQNDAARAQIQHLEGQIEELKKIVRTWLEKDDQEGLINLLPSRALLHQN